MSEADVSTPVPLPLPPPSVYARVGSYDLLRTIGHGNFSVCKLAQNRHTQDLFAIKCIQKKNLDSYNLARVYREIEIMKSLDHPNIIKLHQVMESKSMLYLVCEYACNGEIFDYILKHGAMSEKMACEKFCQIVSAVEYCHLKEIAHRDLKSENLLLDANMNIKLIDFGFANYFDLTNPLKTFCGSPPYADPEIFCGKKYYGPEIDIWSLGVLLYVLVCASLPFDSENLQLLKQKVCQCKYRIPYDVSNDCQNLLANILVVSPSKRFKLQQIKAHKWIKTNSSSTYYHLFNAATTASTRRGRFNRISNKFKSKSMKHLSLDKPDKTSASTSSSTMTSSQAANTMEVGSTEAATSTPLPLMTTAATSTVTPAMSHLSLPLYSFEQYYPLKVFVPKQELSSPLSSPPPAPSPHQTQQSSCDGINSQQENAIVADNLPSLVRCLSLTSNNSCISTMQPQQHIYTTNKSMAITQASLTPTSTTTAPNSSIDIDEKSSTSSVKLGGITMANAMSHEAKVVLLKNAAFAKLVSTSSSLDEGVESDLSSPISSTFSFASMKSKNGFHPHLASILASGYNPHSSCYCHAPTTSANMNASSCLNSFDSSSSSCCCSFGPPSPSVSVKASLDDGTSAPGSMSNHAFTHYSTSVSPTTSVQSTAIANKKHSLPASLAVNRKYKFATLKRNFFIRYKQHQQQQNLMTNNLSQLKCELNSLIKTSVSTPRESITSLSSTDESSNQRTPTPTPIVQASTPINLEQQPQRYRQFVFFKNHNHHYNIQSSKRKFAAAAANAAAIIETQDQQMSSATADGTAAASAVAVALALTTATPTKTTRITRRTNLSRQKSTSLHSLVDEKVNSSTTTQVSVNSMSSKVKTTAGNLTKNLNSKFKFYRKYSLKN